LPTAAALPRVAVGVAMRGVTWGESATLVFAATTMALLASPAPRAISTTLPEVIDKDASLTA